MFISPGNYDQAYEQIKQDALKGDTTVQMLVASNVDAMCAAKMLMSMFRSDFIRYTFVPCGSLFDLHKARDDLIESPGDIQSIICINAGGTSDILQEFDAVEGQQLQNVKFYIIDSHRPLNLSNVYDEDRVIVFDDGETRDQVPEMNEVWNLSGDEDEESEQDENSDTNNTPSKRRRTDGRMSPRSKREQRQRREDTERDYYRSSSFGQATAILMWQLASDLGKSDNQMLWLSIVGMTDQFMEDRVDSTSYAQAVVQLSDDVRRLNIIEDEAEGESMDRIRIKPEDEMRFMLLRQWTVHDAMVHSRYIATRLGIWRQIGKQKLRNLLAKMGMPMEQCQQKYASMDFGLRKQLVEQLQRHAPDFKLDQCVFPSFVSQASFRHQYSASDVVYSVSGLLESTLAAQNGDAIDWRTNFYEAFDALSMKKEVLMRKGMDQCQRQHKAILRQVESIVDGNNELRKLSGFRYTTIKDHPDQDYFIHFPTLRKLGLYLIDTHRFNSDKKRKALPLLIAALNPATETYMVVGMWNSSDMEEGHVVGNEFGGYFTQAAEDVQARASMTEFDSSVMEIKSDDFQKFIIKLSYLVKGRRELKSWP